MHGKVVHSPTEGAREGGRAEGGCWNLPRPMEPGRDGASREAFVERAGAESESVSVSECKCGYEYEYVSE